MGNPLKVWRKEPVEFIEEILGCLSLEGFQKEVCNAIAKHNRVAISACHAVGKTFTVAKIVPWFLYSYPFSYVITTAPTNRQVKELLWGEIATDYERAKYPLGGHLTTKEWTLGPKWKAIGFSPEKKSEKTEGQAGSTFQGFHAKYILVIFDEATGVSPDIWKQVEGLLTSGAVVKFVCIGNPTTKDCDFYKCFQSAFWKKIHLNCFNSPNLIANGITDKNKLIEELDELKLLSDEDKMERIAGYLKPVPELLSLQWVMERALEWGIDHVLFVTKVLGEFPTDEEGSLFPLSIVEEAQARDVAYHEEQDSHLGVDVARFGSDSSVITKIKGKVAQEPIRKRMKRNTELVGILVEMINEDQTIKTVSVDSTGLGAGVIDGLIEQRSMGNIRSDIYLREIHFGQGVGVEEKERFLNYKAKAFFDLAKDMRECIKIGNDSSYQKQLPTLRFEMLSNGKVKMESKDEYKKRTGLFSPDESDSLALANDGRRFYDEKDVSYSISFGSLEKGSNWKGYG